MYRKFLISSLISIMYLLPVHVSAATGDFLWSGEIGGDQATWSTPVLYDNLVIIKGQDGGITSLYSSTGVQAWYNGDIGASLTSPILHGNLLYFGADDHFYKMLPSTGAVLTDRTLDGACSDRAAAALGNLVFFVVSGSSGYTLHAVSADTLEDAWTKPLAASGSVLTDGTNLYVLSDALAALDPATGDVRWSVSAPSGYGTFNEGALADGYLVAFVNQQFGGDSALVAWAVGDGSVAPSTPAWTQEYTGGSTDGSPPAIDGGRVFANSRAGVLHAYALTSGSALWSYPVRSDTLAPALPSAVDDKVYIQLFGDTPALVCLDGASGAEAWKTSRSMGIVWGQPAIGGGRVYLATDHGGGVFAFASGNLSHIWPMYKNNPAQTSASTTLAPAGATAPMTLMLLQ